MKEDGGVVFMKLLFCRWLNVRQNAELRVCHDYILNWYVYIYTHAYDAHSKIGENGEQRERCIKIFKGVTSKYARWTLLLPVFFQQDCTAIRVSYGLISSSNKTAKV